MSENLEVKIVAIDEESAILESTNISLGLQLFKWPLQKLPQLCKIGDHFILELKSSTPHQVVTEAVKQPVKEKYQLLEALIN